MASTVPEPSPRWGHYSAAVGGQLYVYGGRTKDFISEESEVGVSIHTLSKSKKTWESRSTTGLLPCGLYDGTSACLDQQFYLYGGWDGSCHHDSLHHLDIETLEWSMLPSGPTKKVGSGMVSYEEKLVLFGGYGIPSVPTQPGQFTKNAKLADGRGWTNELHCFDLKNGMWSAPTVTGTKPPPCAEFSLTSMDDNCAVLFGGQCGPNLGKSNSLYMLDLTKMHWSVADKEEGKPWPVKRDRHAAVCLGYGGEHPQLLVTGGLDESEKVLSDAWVCDIHTQKWKEVATPCLQARCDHTATALRLSPEHTEVTLFGGCPEWPSDPKSDEELPQIANTTTLKFEYQLSAGEWVLTDAADTADNRHLGEENRESVCIPTVQCIEDEEVNDGDCRKVTRPDGNGDEVRSLFESYGLSKEDYRKIVTDAHLEEFTRDYGGDWRLIYPHLKLKHIVVKDTERTHGEERERRHAFFMKWKLNRQHHATYKKLVKALLKMKYQEDAEGLCKLLQQSSWESGSDGSSSSSQYSEVESVDPGIKSDLLQQLQYNYKTIGVKYASYVRCIRMSLKEKEVSPEDLRSYLLNLPIQYDKSTRTGIEKAKTLEDIFVALDKYCSFWNYEIFQYLVDEYSLDKGNEKLQYTENFNSYVEQHKVSEFISINPQLAKYTAESKDSQKVTVKFDIDAVNCSLSKINELKKTVASTLGIKTSTLRLLSIQEGCTEVALIVPTSQADTLFTDKLLEQSEDLQAASVLSITCADNTYNMKEKKCIISQNTRRQNSSVVSEPCPRWGHFSAPAEGELCVWGGCTHTKTTEPVYTFDPYSRLWRARNATNPPHLYLYEGACASDGSCLYLYGGYDGSDFQGSLYQLDCRTWEWSQLVGGGDVPMRKMGCKMVMCDDRLVLFGGYGISPVSPQPGAEFNPDSRFSEGVGWTNELHVFGVFGRVWSSPTDTGTRPPPCSDFSLTMVEEQSAVLFGGSVLSKGSTSHVYLINLRNMHWSELEPCPVDKSDHTAVCLGYGSNNPNLFVIGGREALIDAWALNLNDRKWTKVEVPFLLPRYLHSAAAFTVTPGVTDIVLFGGCSELPSKVSKDDADYSKLASTTVLRSGSSTEDEWKLVM